MTCHGKQAVSASIEAQAQSSRNGWRLELAAANNDEAFNEEQACCATLLGKEAAVDVTWSVDRQAGLSEPATIVKRMLFMCRVAEEYLRQMM